MQKRKMIEQEALVTTKHDDTGAVRASLDAHENVAPGAGGHCMSGRFALTVAARLRRMRPAAARARVAKVEHVLDSLPALRPVEPQPRARRHDA